MPDVIAILPDSVANKIAAGEVVLRPSSVIKELLENAVDAGSTKITVIVNDGGKSLMQVIDNGCGMSETDARLCLERHATSKIRNADDLFNIRTFGFRGEALASIAAVAQVAVKTKRDHDETATEVTAENSNVVSQETVSAPTGTSVTVKNIFFNIPARKKFLKNDSVEMKHMVDEFLNMAIAHPEISFALHHNNQCMYQLEKASLRQRIVSVFGNHINEKIVPVDEDTQLVKISGFVSKPEFSRRSRSDQYLFLNKRHIRSPYLHHAVLSAYEKMIPPELNIFYFLFLEVDPSSVDVNIHPSKTEVKFDNEKAVYAIVSASVKSGLGKANLVPSIDFNPESSFNPVPVNVFRRENSGTITGTQQPNLRHWEKLFEGSLPGPLPSYPSVQADPVTDDPVQPELKFPTDEPPSAGNEAKHYLLVSGRYMVTPVKSGLMIIDCVLAAERICFEKLTLPGQKEHGECQQLLFPLVIELHPGDAMLMEEITGVVNEMGFEVKPIGKNSVVINGIPAGFHADNTKEIMESFIEDVRMNSTQLKDTPRENLAVIMAGKFARSRKIPDSHEEMEKLVNMLFACRIPYYSPSGKQVIVLITADELKQRFA